MVQGSPLCHLKILKEKNKIMTRPKGYGKSLENPANFNCVRASIIFLNTLVTTEGYHITYHRPGSLENSHKVIIDHYETISGDNRYDDIYILTSTIPKIPGYRRKGIFLKVFRIS